MKKAGITFLLLNFILIIFLSFCKKETKVTNQSLSVNTIDIHTIENLTGCQFNILKSESLGYIPLHKFYWICLKDEVNNQKLNELAEAIIISTIQKKPKTYHSFTIHFFLESELKERVENSKSFAKANYLPQGSWIKVGRGPIEDYNDYELTCTILE